MTDIKIQIRPEIPSIVKSNSLSNEEKFQNEVLRPIIKLQHELILSLFEYYLERNKIKIKEHNNKEKTDLLNKIFKTDTRLKMEFRGLIIGLFTVEEYEIYLSLSPQLNKRINNMIFQRIESCYNE